MLRAMGLQFRRCSALLGRRAVPRLGHGAPECAAAQQGPAGLSEVRITRDPGLYLIVPGLVMMAAGALAAAARRVLKPAGAGEASDGNG